MLGNRCCGPIWGFRHSDPAAEAFDVKTADFFWTQSADFGGSAWPGACQCRADSKCTSDGKVKEWCYVESALYCGDAVQSAINDDEKDAWSFNVCNVPDIPGNGHALLRSGSECVADDGDVDFGAQSTVEACAQRCRDHAGCSHFLFAAPEPSQGNGCDYVIASSDDICECAPSSGSSVACDTALWTSLDNDVICGECKALVEIEVYGTCDAYCAAQQDGLDCVGSYTDHDDTCFVPGEAEGSCRMAFAGADDCGASGFQDSVFDYHRLDDTAAPDPIWETRPGVWNASDPVPFRICLVEEAVGGRLGMVPVVAELSCLEKSSWVFVANPAVTLSGAAAATVQTFDESIITDRGVWNLDAVVLSGHATSCSISSQGGRALIGISNGTTITFYRHDRRVRWVNNTVESPADIDANIQSPARNGVCPEVPRSSLNEDSCVRHDASSCGRPSFSSAAMVLDHLTLASWYTDSAKSVYAVKGLRFEAGLRSTHPFCNYDEPSRWAKVAESGGCSVEDGGGSGTVHTWPWGFGATTALTIAVGDTVRWTWTLDGDRHDVVSGTRPVHDGEFRSPYQSSGAFSHTFTQVGTFSFFCSPHPGMDANVTVAEGTPQPSTPVITGSTADKVASAIRGACGDNPSFIDALGHSCREWRGYDCSHKQQGYTDAGMVAVRENCRDTCHICADTPPAAGQIDPNPTIRDVVVSDFVPPDDCNASLWTDIKSGGCGLCGALVNIGSYGSCRVYCAAQQDGLDCVGSYTDTDDTCVRDSENHGCDYETSSSDDICVCASSAVPIDAHVLLQSNVECESDEGEYDFGIQNNDVECAQQCRDRIGCQYFLFGVGAAAGECRMEGAGGSDDCGSEGFRVANYGFYKLNDTTGEVCSFDASTIGARVEVDGACWQHSHPDEGSVYDFSRWAGQHPGNIDLLERYQRDPFNAVGEAGLSELVYPGWHEMERWEDNVDKHLTYVGKLGSTADFSTLPASLQTIRMAASTGSSAEYEGIGFVSCGSRGEVANDPAMANRFYVSEGSDPYTDSGIDQEGSFYGGKHMTWTTVVLGATDQLRQRVAWGLSQIFSVGAQNFGYDRDTEVWARFMDIFVANAFGNYRDIIQEVSMSPLMGR